jgi:radical SAM protein with 4Fe4S-binding SPASM domain
VQAETPAPDAMADLIRRARLLRGLMNGEKAHTGPFYADIDLTNRCNLACVGCIYQSPQAQETGWGKRPTEDLPFDAAVKLMGELRAMGTDLVILQGGGEPFLHPRLLDMVAEAKGLGLRVMILTNGTLLDRENATTLFDLGLDVLRISLWASSEEQFRVNYPDRDPGLFRKIVEGVRLAVELKKERGADRPEILLYTPINSTNYTTLDDYVDLGLETGADGFSFGPMNTASGALASFALSEEEEAEVRRTLERLKRRLEGLSLSHNIDQILLRYQLGKEQWKTLPCYVTWYHARFRTDGNIQPCGRCDPDLSLGNFMEEPLEKIWNGEALRKFRREGLTLSRGACSRRSCDCEYCCYAQDNHKIHRVLGKLPFIRQPSLGG